MTFPASFQLPVACALLVFFSGLGAFPVEALDLTDAVIVRPDTLSKPEQNAVRMLRAEVETRAHVRWKEASEWPANGQPAIGIGPASAWKQFGGTHASEATLGPEADQPEGFAIRVKSGGAAPAALAGGTGDFRQP